MSFLCLFGRDEKPRDAARSLRSHKRTTIRRMIASESSNKTMARHKVQIISPEATPISRRNATGRNRGGAHQNNGGSSNSIRRAEKGLYELSIFCAAIATGTACSISSKVMYDLKGVGTDGTLQHFDKPLVQTLGMFLAMVLGLPIHWFIIYFNIPFPGYDQFKDRPTKDFINGSPKSAKAFSATTGELESLWPADGHNEDDDMESLVTVTTPAKTYFILALPATFDLITTALSMVGLVYLDVSVYQLLRGSGIIFTALIRQWALQRPLYRFQWVGVIMNVVSVFLVGITALLDSSQSQENNPEQVMMAIVIMLLGTFVQSMQFVFEEKVMVQDEVKVPPLLLFGMEGVWYVHVYCLLVRVVKRSKVSHIAFFFTGARSFAF